MFEKFNFRPVILYFFFLLSFRMAIPIMVSNLKLKDSQEGIAAFVGKRKPQWTNTEEEVN